MQGQCPCSAICPHAYSARNTPFRNIPRLRTSTRVAVRHRSAPQALPGGVQYDHVLAFGDVHQALAFLVAWPDLRRASELVLGRARELNGDLYELLSPAAEALVARHPLAATVVRRAMIDFTLGTARSSRYKHAARHLCQCRVEAARIEDFGAVPNHSTY